MVESSKQFTKAPRRKKEPAKRVVLSPEARKAYEDEIKARAEHEAYLSKLGNREPR